MKTLLFGNYWQTNNVEKEPIEWLVLKEEEDKIYVISKLCLDFVPYSNGHHTLWKNSLMRKWLNQTFINEAFSAEEQERIILSEVRTDPCGWYGQKEDNGKPVKDNIFLPSIMEAIRYFDSETWHDILAEQKRIARPSNYANEKGCWSWCLKYAPLEFYSIYEDSIDPNKSYWAYDSTGCDEDFKEDSSEQRWSTCWYLRSPGYGTVIIEPNGEIRSYSEKNHQGAAVRPAMWIKK